MPISQYRAERPRLAAPFATVLSLFAVLSATPAAATENDIPVTVNLNGFFRVEYGAGSRYDGLSGSDRYGVSRAALVTTAKYQNTDAIVVLGTGDLTGDTPGDFNGDVFLVDIYATTHNVFGAKLSLSAGLRPILFGLHPEGFPGDRSLQSSIEFGGAGQFASSNQAGATLIATYPIFKSITLEAGTFDSDAGRLTPPDGSTIVDNNFVQVRFHSLGDTGLYGSVGAERRFVAESNTSKAIYDAGLGWAKGPFDLSIEYVSLDSAIAGTADNERYIVTKNSFSPRENLKFYVDWANAHRADVKTLRVGGVYGINKLLSFQLEYSRDSETLRDVSSVDARIAASF